MDILPVHLFSNSTERNSTERNCIKTFCFCQFLVNNQFYHMQFLFCMLIFIINIHHELDRTKQFVFISQPICEKVLNNSPVIAGFDMIQDLTTVLLNQLYCMFFHHFEYYILKCLLSWYSQEHMKGPKALFCSIFINIWEKRKLGVLKGKENSLFSFFFLFVLSSFYFPSLFSLIKVSLIYPFILLVSCLVLCLLLALFFLSCIF